MVELIDLACHSSSASALCRYLRKIEGVCPYLDDVLGVEEVVEEGLLEGVQLIEGEVLRLLRRPGD